MDAFKYLHKIIKKNSCDDTTIRSILVLKGQDSFFRSCDLKMNLDVLSNLVIDRCILDLSKLKAGEKRIERNVHGDLIFNNVIFVTDTRNDTFDVDPINIMKANAKVLLSDCFVMCKEYKNDIYPINHNYNPYMSLSGFYNRFIRSFKK